MDVKYPDVTVQLTGRDGNALAIMGAVHRAIRRAHGTEAADAYRTEALSGDYDHVLQHTLATVNVE